MGKKEFLTFVVFCGVFNLWAPCFVNGSEADAEPYIHWRMERTREDAMGNENFMDLQNIAFSKDCLEGSYSMYFDRTQNSAAIISFQDANGSKFLQKRVKERTVSLWFKPTRLLDFGEKAEYYLLSVGAEKSNGFFVFLKNDQLHVSAQYKMKGVLSRADMQGAYLPDVWNHVAYRFKEGNSSLFLNGEKIAEEHVPEMVALRCYKKKNGAMLGAKVKHRFSKSDPSYASTNGDVELQSNDYFNGFIDDVRFYEAALPDKKIIKIYRPSL